MSDELDSFLSKRAPFAIENVQWGETTQLELSCYIGDQIPPLDYVTSVRAVLLKGNRVLVLRDKSGTCHLLPGGRCEKGETPLQTLTREVREETKWTLAKPELIGFMRFVHQTPKPLGYAYPYPTFLQLVYAAKADRPLPDAKIEDEWVDEAFFTPIDALAPYGIASAQQRYLAHALRRQGHAP